MRPLLLGPPLALIHRTVAARWLADANHPWDHKNKCSTRCEPSNPRVGIARLKSTAGHRNPRSRRIKTGVRKSQSSEEWSARPIKRRGPRTGQACPQGIPSLDQSRFLFLPRSLSLPSVYAPSPLPRPALIFATSPLPPHRLVNIKPVTLYDSHQARPHLRRIYTPCRTAVYILNLSLYWGPRCGGSVCGSWRAELQADEVVQRILD